MISAASIKSRLKNLSIKEKSTMQNELVTYALERTIYRMSNQKTYSNIIFSLNLSLLSCPNCSYTGLSVHGTTKETLKTFL